MNIVFASENKEKISGLKKVFPGASILTLKANSLVGPAANNTGLFNALYNKIELGVMPKLSEDDIDLTECDAIIALKSGYCKKISKKWGESNRYFITDVCAIKDKVGYRVANGPMYEISKELYEAALKDNKILERIKELDKNDLENSIINYISEGLVTRSYATRVAVKKAIESPYIDFEDAQLDFSSIIKFENDKIKALERKCFEETLEYLPTNK